mmetsp:Transcript_26015/g.56994  ORF Transcript_26015/g.56994 Transcript_26015/m.56994 type:complete len:208 (-) Transcript_26015:175-798(-)
MASTFSVMTLYILVYGVLFELEYGIRTVGSQKFLRIVIVASRIFTAWLWRSEAILKTPMAPLRCSSLSLHILKRSASHPWLASCVKLIDLASLNATSVNFLAASPRHALSLRSFWRPYTPASAPWFPAEVWVITQRKVLAAGTFFPFTMASTLSSIDWAWAKQCKELCSCCSSHCLRNIAPRHALNLLQALRLTLDALQTLHPSPVC